MIKGGWESVLREDEHRMIESDKEGLKLVIYENDTIVYRGEFDEELNHIPLYFGGYCKRNDCIKRNGMEIKQELNK